MNKFRKAAVTAAVVVGAAAGSYGIAAAAAGPAPTPTEANDVLDAQLNGSAQVDETSVTDEETDGIDHEFEGEEIGNNGDGVPDANEATEAN